jgi:hypothetical protein
MTNFIGEYEVRQESVDALLSLFEEHRHLAEPGSIGADKIVDSDKKDSLDLSFLPQDPPKKASPYLEDLALCVEKYKKEFLPCNENQNSWQVREIIKLQYYRPGGGYKVTHCENQGHNIHEVQRHLVFMTYLNTIPPKKGGGTEFIYQKTFNAVAGKTLIWPAAWTHSHRGVISPTHEKYIVTGWFSYNLFQY